MSAAGLLDPAEVEVSADELLALLGELGGSADARRLAEGLGVSARAAHLRLAALQSQGSVTRVGSVWHAAAAVPALRDRIMQYLREHGPAHYLDVSRAVAADAGPVRRELREMHVEGLLRGAGVAWEVQEAPVVEAVAPPKVEAEPRRVRPARPRVARVSEVAARDGTRRAAIVAAIGRADAPVSTAEIAEVLGHPAKALASHLYQLARAGVVVLVSPGRWSLPASAPRPQATEPDDAPRTRDEPWATHVRRTERWVSSALEIAEAELERQREIARTSIRRDYTEHATAAEAVWDGRVLRLRGLVARTRELLAEVGAGAAGEGA